MELLLARDCLRVGRLVRQPFHRPRQRRNECSQLIALFLGQVETGRLVAGPIERLRLGLARIAQTQFVRTSRLHEVRQAGGLRLPAKSADAPVGPAQRPANGDVFGAGRRHGPLEPLVLLVGDDHAIGDGVEPVRAEQRRRVPLGDQHASRHSNQIAAAFARQRDASFRSSPRIVARRLHSSSPSNAGQYLLTSRAPASHRNPAGLSNNPSCLRHCVHRAYGVSCVRFGESSRQIRTALTE